MHLKGLCLKAININKHGLTMSKTIDKKTVVKKANENFAFFCFFFYEDEFRREFHSHQLEIIKALLITDLNFINIVAPRGTGKTTIIKNFIRWNIMRRTARCVVYITDAAATAIDRTESIKKGIIENSRILEYYGDIVSENVSARTGKIQQLGKEVYKLLDTVVFPKGRNQQVRGTLGDGYRPDLIVCDDAIKKDAYKSETQRLKFIAWFNSDVIHCHDEQETNYRYFYIDTLKHPDGLMAHLMANPMWHTVHIEAFDDNFKTTDSKFLSQKRIDEKVASARMDNTLPELILEYRGMQTSEDTDIQFNYAVDKGAYCALCKKDLLNNIVETDINLDYRTAITFILCDPARTVGAKSAESAVIAVSFFQAEGVIVIRDSIGIKVKPDDLYDMMFDFADKYNASYLGVETNGVELFISQPIENRIALENRTIEYIPLRAVGGKESDDAKIARIKPLFPLYNRGIIYHIINKCNRLETQLLAFPYPSKWDLADAASYINAIMKKQELVSMPMEMAPPAPDLDYLEKLYEALGGRVALPEYQTNVNFMRNIHYGFGQRQTMENSVR